MVSLADSSLFYRWPKALIAIDANNVITQANDKACLLLGWSEKELAGKPLHDSLCSHALGYLHADDDCPIEKHAFYLKDAYYEYRWKLKSGDLHAFYAKGILLHPENTRLIVFSDESNTNYSQKDMQRLASFAEHSPTPIIEFDQQGSIEFTNPSMVELLGEVGFDDNGFPLVLPDNLAVWIEKILVDGKPMLGVERTIENKSFLWDFYPIPGESGILIQAYGQDVTDAKNLATSLEREKEFAESANKAKSEFLSVMSHELRTPMNSIIGFSRRLLNRGKDELPELYVNALRTILENSNLLLTMINETLDMSKIEAGKMNPSIVNCRPAKIGTEVHQLLVVQAEDKSLTLNLHLDPELPETINTDHDFLRKIMVNLVGNAIKFTDKGSIDIAMRTAGENRLLVAVRDDGIGIDEKDQALIFDKFSQASGQEARRYNGTGLGLSLCQELTHLLGGAIGLESTKGEGSTFWIEIPTDHPIKED